MKGWTSLRGLGPGEHPVVHITNVCRDAPVSNAMSSNDVFQMYKHVWDIVLYWVYANGNAKVTAHTLNSKVCILTVF